MLSKRMVKQEPVSSQINSKYTQTFKKTFMDTMKLFMAIPDCINFLQLGRYGCFSEQTYRNLFEQTSESWIFTSMRRLQPSTWPKRHVRGSE